MPPSAGSSPDGPALEMRLSVPADGSFRGIASELAARIAEYLGAASPDAQSLGASVEGLASRVVNGSAPEEHITFEFLQVQGALVIRARCNDQASEVRHPLPV